MTNTDQQLIDDAKKAGFVTFEGEKGDIGFDTYDFTLAECLAKFAQLQRERQAQPTPSQSEPVARFVRNSNSCAIITLSYIEDGALLYSNPQPTSQAVKDALEQAANMCETELARNDGITCADAIRALIQTEKGE